MRISTKGRYGLRAMIEIARNYGAGPLEMRVITERQKIPRKYLHALLTTLRASGLIRSLRGSHGGYTLARPPAQISARDVVVALEGPVVLVDCKERGPSCELFESCPTRALWWDLSRIIDERLAAVSLEEMAKTKRPARSSRAVL
jgi:Rrf2 family transcriptional regulator, cysteine metabolism repressor